MPPTPQAQTVTPRRFVDALPMPSVHSSLSKSSSGTYYEVRIVEAFHKFHSDLPPTRIFAYEGVYPGPTFVVKQNERVQVKFINQIPQGSMHVLPIDTTIKEAERKDVSIRTVVHLHGGFVSAEDDGHPFAWFTKDFNVTGEKYKKQVYVYENRQSPTTLIYHDHAVGITRLNVMAGMIGLYIITPTDFSTFSPYDVPLLIQDKSFMNNGDMYYPTMSDSSMAAMSISPSIVSKFFGDVIMVNGKIWPFLNVEPRKYRFRVVNGCNGRTLNVSFVADATGAKLPINIVGSDQAAYDKVVTVSSFDLAAAERIDIVVDFSQYGGKKLTITNVDMPMFPKSGNFTTLVMQINVSLPLVTTNVAISEDQIISNTPIKYSAATKVRTIGTSMTMDKYGRSIHQFDSKSYFDAPTETPFANTTEIWAIYNNDADFDHPIHIHGARVILLNRTYFDNDIYMSKKQYVWTSDTQLPKAYEYGWKDVIRAAPSSLTYILVEFGPSAGDFVWHCHLLEHEDYDMMRPLIIQTAPKTSFKTSAAIPTTEMFLSFILLCIMIACLV